MRFRKRFLLLTGLALLAPSLGRAEVKTTVQRNDPEHATPAFKFASVPAPSKTDAGNSAKISLLNGRADPNGAGVEALIDGALPAGADNPDGNFFFAQRAPGGRVVMDLGKAVAVQQVNTYSWHPDTRGPQVYTLYAADGAAKEFDAAPAADADPAKSGWTRVAAVDTRPKDARPGPDFGGQYGVSIASDADGPIGKYRYLLFDIAPTETDDPFGNTFFSEIDVSDGKEHPVVEPEGLTTLQIEGGCEVTFDVRETPELAKWVEDTLKPAVAKWYPIIVKMLPSDRYAPPKQFPIVFKKGMDGVAYTAGTKVVCAGPWFTKNLKGEATGAVIHELVHVVQQYGRNRRGKPNPGWLVEGLADYIRWFKFEPPDRRPHPNPARAKYTDSYRTTGAFIDYVAEHHDKDIAQKLNAAMRDGKYEESLWKVYTSMTVQQLWTEYVKTLAKRE